MTNKKIAAAANLNLANQVFVQADESVERSERISIEKNKSTLLCQTNFATFVLSNIIDIGSRKSVVLIIKIESVFLCH